MGVLRPGKLTLWVQDEKKKLGKVSIHLPSATTIASLDNFVNFWTNRVDALLYGRVISCTYSVPMALGVAVKSAPIAKGDIEEGANFKFRSANEFIDIRLPAFNPFWFADDSNLVVSNGTIALFEDSVLNGILGVNPCSIHGEDIITQISKLKSIKASRGG